MVVYYKIAGRQIASHYLAIATLGSAFIVGKLSMGGNKASKEQGPPIVASSGEEERFIRDFIEKAEKEQQAGSGH